MDAARLFRHTTIVSCMFIASSFAAAQADNALSLRQVTLGTPIATFPECPKTANSTRYLESAEGPPELRDRVCFKRESPLASAPQISFYKVDNLPLLMGAGREVEVMVIGEAIEAIEFTFLNQIQADLLVGLKEKFGPATKVQTVEYRNRSGLPVQGARLIWHLDQGTVTYEEFDRRLDMGRVSIRSRAFDEVVLKWTKQRDQGLKKAL